MSEKVLIWLPGTTRPRRSAPHCKMRCGLVLTERLRVAVDLVEVVGGPLRVLHHVKAQTARFVAHGGGGVLRDSGQTGPAFSGRTCNDTIRGWCSVWLCKHGPLVDGVSLPQPRRQIPSEQFGGKQLCGAYRLPACRRQYGARHRPIPDFFVAHAVDGQSVDWRPASSACRLARTCSRITRSALSPSLATISSSTWWCSRSDCSGRPG